MARSAGVEPTTVCLEGRCSIQLSYERNRGNRMGLFLMLKRLSMTGSETATRAAVVLFPFLLPRRGS